MRKLQFVGIARRKSIKMVAGLITGIAVASTALNAAAVESTEEDMPAQTIIVTHTEDEWCIKDLKHIVTLNEKDFSLSVKDGLVAWNFLPSDDNDISINAGSRDFSFRLTAGLPYLSIAPGDSELERVRTACTLNKRAGLLEMTNHEFLDKDFRIQRTTFSDGTTVTIDLDSSGYTISQAKQ